MQQNVPCQVQKVRNPVEIKILDPDCDPDRAQKLTSLSLA